MLDIANAVQTWGYPLVAFGAFMQGEVILLFAGFAAYRGHLEFAAVVAVAFVASVIGNQAFFFLGRRYGAALVRRWPSLRAPIARFTLLLQRFHTPLILVMRLLYGLSIAGPIALGFTDISWRRFLGLNLIGGIAWALLVAGIGYQFGHMLDAILPHLHRAELLVLALLIAAAVWLWRR